MSSNLGNKQIMSQNILRLMKKKDIDRKTLAESLDIKYSTLSDWINANTYPRIDKIEKMARYFNVSKADLVEPFLEDRNISIKYPTHRVTDKEVLIIKKYRALDDYGIKAIDDLLDTEYKRVQEQSNAIYDNNGNRITSFYSYLDFKYQSAQALYIDKVSAGLGFFPIEEDYHSIGSPFSNSDYAFSVDGDSMSPKYQNGDMVYVKKQSVLSDGEIGVMVYNNKGYLKKYYRDNNMIILVSLNEAYNDISIALDENTDFHIIGKVIGHVPLKEFIR